MLIARVEIAHQTSKESPGVFENVGQSASVSFENIGILFSCFWLWCQFESNGRIACRSRAVVFVNKLTFIFEIGYWGIAHAGVCGRFKLQLNTNVAALADFVWLYEGHYFIYRSAALKASNELTKKQPLPLERVGLLRKFQLIWICWEIWLYWFVDVPCTAGYAGELTRL